MAARTVGIIGLGLVGAAVAERLIAAGFAVCGIDVEAARNDAFVRQGGRMAAGADLSACEAIIVAVYDGREADGVLAQIAAAKSTAPVICLTTCDVETITALATRANAAGFSLVEAPLSGTSLQVRNGESTALVAGEDAAIRAVSSVLSAICARIVRVGAIGNASRMKLAVNLVLQANRAALAEGIAFAEAVGLDGASFLEAAMASAAYSQVMETKGRKMLQRDFTPQSRIAQTLKDADLIMQAASRVGLHLPVTTAQRELLRDTIELAGENVDSSAIIAVLAAGAGRAR